MAQMMQVRAGVFRVVPEDFPRVVAVWEAAVRATHDFVTEADIAIFRPLVTAALPALQLACVRDEAGRVVGFTAVAAGKVEMLFVDPAWRGQGIGRRLLNHAVAQLHATTLDVNEQNTQAVGFYQRLGFAVVGRSPLDGTGKPYPLLHMRLVGSSDHEKEEMRRGDTSL